MHIAPASDRRTLRARPVPSFAYHFREHIIPVLRREIAKCGPLLALDIIDWNEAEQRVTKLARRYGSEHLPTDSHAELFDWIDANLLNQELTTEAQIESFAAELARRETTDPISYYDELAAGCRDPKGMRWVFAAISPPYRTHLLAEARRG